ncbi:MAG: DUF3880 domain-containing protein [Butyrivibrio sp.]
MKILMYRWKAYNQQDIINNLIKRGHEVHEIKGEMCNFDDDSLFMSDFSSKIDSDRYDMVFTVNYFPMISDICQERGIPYVSWCCDCPLGTMYHESVYNPVNTIFTFDKFNQLEFEGMGVNVRYLPLCAEVDRVAEVLDAATDLQDYDCDISFVGSMYNKNSYDEVYDRLPEYLRGYFDGALKMQMNVYGEYLLDDVLDSHTIYELNRHFVLAKSSRSFSDIPLVFSTTVLGFKLAQMERKSVLALLAGKYKVTLYTDDNNIKMPGIDNRGIADYWETAPKIFNRSRINLNLTLRNIRSGIPLRVWDILGAGGFCITNYQPELGMYFENGKNLVYFTDKNDLLRKIDYYLEHEDERREIALNGMKKVHKFHSYTDRFNEMSKIITNI